MANPFLPPPEIDRLPAADVGRVYRYWRARQLYSTFIGYAVFYYVRENLPLAVPLMERDLGLSKATMGGFMTAHGVVYGFSKFLNGMVGDRANPRVFMVVGLLLSALANVAFGMSGSLYFFTLWWLLNGWFQGMGFPPCARIMSHWFAVSERGRWWGVWNSSHQAGAFSILILAGWLGDHYGWRAVFYGPAAIAVVVSLFLANRLRDTPGSLGLPPVEEYVHGRKEQLTEVAESGPETESFFSMLVNRVFSNPYIWIICCANFFVYAIRYSFLNWTPAFLVGQQGLSATLAGWITACFELFGLVGALLAGWFGDRFGRVPVAVVYMLATGAAIYCTSTVPAGHPWLSALSIGAVGFCIYGPQFLVGVMTVDLASKEAAATSIGLTGLFGYMSSVASGWGLGYLVQLRGWGISFQVEIGCSLVSAALFAMCWGSRRSVRV